jgi:hypothetical protein
MISEDKMKDEDGVAQPNMFLRPGIIERVFTECMLDLGHILVIDWIDMFPDGFRLRSHDLHGPLPEVVIANSGDTFQDKDRLGNETFKLLAMVKLRE